MAPHKTSGDSNGKPPVTMPYPSKRKEVGDWLKGQAQCEEPVALARAVAWGTGYRFASHFCWLRHFL
jgi:hypothetical protein